MSWKGGGVKPAHCFQRVTTTLEIQVTGQQFSAFQLFTFMKYKIVLSLPAFLSPRGTFSPAVNFVKGQSGSEQGAPHCLC